MRGRFPPSGFDMTEIMQKVALGVDKDDAEGGPEKAEVKADVEAKTRLCLLTLLYLTYFTYFTLLYLPTRLETACDTK